ncbi:MAG: tyrosine-protein kinase family protein [Candidatus Omnitrophota bacterium]
MNIKHIDEVRKELISELLGLLQKLPTTYRIALIHDLYGRFKLVLWPGKEKGIEKHNRLVEILNEKLKEFSPFIEPDSIWVSNEETPKLDKKIYDSVWDEGEPHLDEPRLRISERYRTHGGWIDPLMAPPWKNPDRPNPEAPPVIVFYSFKGGVGRTTALAAFAIQRARTGERVAVIDADLDAPGIGSFLAADDKGTTAEWGVADYMLEKELHEIDFRDYYHVCRRENVTGAGEILVIPAGRINNDYPWKLARLDMEPFSSKDKKHQSIFYSLLDDVKKNLKPDWILIDVRAGLAVPSGILVGGFAHLNVIFGTSSEQSWQGLILTIQRLGARKIEKKLPQSDLILVHAMVPRNPDLARESEKYFSDRALDEFTELYYAEPTDNKDDENEVWTLEDIESSDAPHIPVPIHYDETLTASGQIDPIAETLIKSPDYINLTERILSHFGELLP